MWEQVSLFPAALSGDSAHGDREPRVGGCSLWTGAASSLSWDAGGVSVQIPKTLLFKPISTDFLEYIFHFLLSLGVFPETLSGCFLTIFSGFAGELVS